MSVDLDKLTERADELWETSILPSLSEFIEIEALSPGFEPDWKNKGELDSAIDLFSKWLVNQELDGMTYQIHRIDGRTPVLLVTVEGTGPVKSYFILIWINNHHEQIFGQMGSILSKQFVEILGFSVEAL
jgi:hypothetical protein